MKSVRRKQRPGLGLRRAAGRAFAVLMGGGLAIAAAPATPAPQIGSPAPGIETPGLARAGQENASKPPADICLTNACSARDDAVARAATAQLAAAIAAGDAVAIRDRGGSVADIIAALQGNLGNIQDVELRKGVAQLLARDGIRFAPARINIEGGGTMAAVATVGPDGLPLFIVTSDMTTVIPHPSSGLVAPGARGRN